MSVSITIAGNREYILSAGRMEYDVYTCQTADIDGTCAGCHECKSPHGNGAGQVRFERLPFDMNLANGNFATLWNSLGLECDYCGSIDGRALLAVLRTFDPALLLREYTESAGVNGCRVIQCGIESKQAQSYIDRLYDIAMEAARREERVVWA